MSMVGEGYNQGDALSASCRGKMRRGRRSCYSRVVMTWVKCEHLSAGGTHQTLVSDVVTIRVKELWLSPGKLKNPLNSEESPWYCIHIRLCRPSSRLPGVNHCVYLPSYIAPEAEGDCSCLLLVLSIGVIQTSKCGRRGPSAPCSLSKWLTGVALFLMCRSPRA
jgi:hypothetical protein